LSADNNNKNNIIMGRFKLDELEKRKNIGASIEKRIINEVGEKKCKSIAEQAVIDFYYKNKK